MNISILLAVMEHLFQVLTSDHPIRDAQ